MNMQLAFSEKGLRKIMDQVKVYQRSLSDASVLNTFQVCPLAACQSLKAPLCSGSTRDTKAAPSTVHPAHIACLQTVQRLGMAEAAWPCSQPHADPADSCAGHHAARPQAEQADGRVQGGCGCL